MIGGAEADEGQNVNFYEAGFTYSPSSGATKLILFCSVVCDGDDYI